MQSQRWMFTSPGGENEYKRPSVTQEQYAAVIGAKQAQEKCPVTESGKFEKPTPVVLHTHATR